MITLRATARCWRGFDRYLLPLTNVAQMRQFAFGINLLRLTVIDRAAWRDPVFRRVPAVLTGCCLNGV